MTSKPESRGELGEGSSAADEKAEEGPVDLIQHIQLVPVSEDKKVSRLARLAGVLSRVIRSRFGLKSVELVDRFAEAKVADLEAKVADLEANVTLKEAQAVDFLASAAHKFAQTKELTADRRSQAGNDTPPSEDIEHDDTDSALAALEAVLARLKEKGGSVHLHLSNRNPKTPKLPD